MLLLVGRWSRADDLKPTQAPHLGLVVDLDVFGRIQQSLVYGVEECTVSVDMAAEETTDSG